MDDAAGVQEVQAPRDVQRDRLAVPAPRVHALVAVREGLPQIAALHTTHRGPSRAFNTDWLRAKRSRSGEH